MPTGETAEAVGPARLSDWNMERMSGYQLLPVVRSDSQLNKSPFIMIAGESNTDNVYALDSTTIVCTYLRTFSYNCRTDREYFAETNSRCIVLTATALPSNRNVTVCCSLN